MFINTQEVKMHLLTDQQVREFINLGNGMSFIAHPKNPLLLGSKALLKVNTNIGVSNKANLRTELEKLELLSKLPYAPDSLMDHIYLIRNIGKDTDI